MSDVMTISKRTAAGLEEVLRTLLLDSENKVPAERLRIVGALADGAIIESGSNANGNYVKLADGTMWCWGEYKEYTFSSTDVYQAFTTILPAAAYPGAIASGNLHHRSMPGKAMLLCNFSLHTNGAIVNWGLTSTDGIAPGVYNFPLFWHVITRWKV